MHALAGGLVDCHAHLTIDLAGTGLPLGSAQLVEANRDRYEGAGVLALRDTGTVPGDGVGPESERLVRCGRFLAPAGRYFPAFHEPVEANELIDAALRELRGGASWVKLIADFPGPDGNWFQPIVNYEPGVIAELAQAVHEEGGRLAAHVSGTLVYDLVAAGVDSIEHGPLVNRDLVREMAAGGIAWTPTLATVIGSIEPMAGMPGPAGDQVRAVIGELGRAVPLAVELGVPLLAGSDEAGPGGLHRELERLVEFGLTPEQAIDAATTVPRAYLDLPVQDGDATVYEGDPRTDLSLLARPNSVKIAGLSRVDAGR